MKYQVHFVSDESADPAVLAELDGALILDETIEACKAHSVRAELRDEPGFARGNVDRDGNYRLR